MGTGAVARVSRTCLVSGLQKVVTVAIVSGRFAGVNSGLVYVYFSSFQSVEEEEFGGAWELTKEGFLQSFAGFLVSRKKGSKMF